MTLDEALVYLQSVAQSLPSDDKVKQFVIAVLVVANEVKQLKEAP